MQVQSHSDVLRHHKRALGGIRTHTVWALSPVPLPVGIRGRGGLSRSRIHPRSPSGPATARMAAMTDAEKPRRVLVAEDEALIRLDLAEMLREEGYEIAGEAADRQEAVDLAES